MEEYRSFDSILEWLNSRVKNREVIGPHEWVNAAQFLNVFLEEEQSKQFLLEQQVAELKMVAMESGETATKAKVRVEASPVYLQMRKQKARVERAIEMIRISKIQARTSNDILNSN